MGKDKDAMLKVEETNPEVIRCVNQLREAANWQLVATKRMHKAYRLASCPLTMSIYKNVVKCWQKLSALSNTLRTFIASFVSWSPPSSLPLLSLRSIE